MLKFEPKEIYYMNTINCNQKCSKCSHWKKHDKSPRLEPNILVEALKDVPSCNDFTIVGGEPLLYANEIISVLEGIKTTNIRTIIITNAVLLDSKFIDKIKKYNVHLIFSIDTIDKDFWHFVRGCPSFDVVMKNLEYAFKHLEKPQMSIQSVLAKETETHIPFVKAFAEKHGLYHSVQDYVQDGFEGSWTVMQYEKIKTNDDKIECFAAGRNLSIMQNGDVRTCFQQNLINGCEKPLGNLNTDSIKTIIESNYTKKVINAMKFCNKSCKVLKCNLKR